MRFLIEIWRDFIGDPAVFGWCVALFTWLWLLAALPLCAAQVASF